MYQVRACRGPSQIRTSATVATYTYDTMGRRNSVEDANGDIAKTDYNTLGLVQHRYGTGTYPSAYTYDSYGCCQTMTTYRSGTFTVSIWPTSPGTGDHITWRYDAYSGLLQSKTYPTVSGVTPTVQYSYNAEGKLSQRTWARGVYATYTYDTNTGLGNGTGTMGLLGISYSDGTTPSVTYGPSSAPYFTRSGPIHIGERHHGHEHLQLHEHERTHGIGQHPYRPFYQNRVLTQLYNSDTLLPGRPTGFKLGTSSVPANDLVQVYAYNSSAFFASMEAESVDATNVATFNYSYWTNSHLIQNITDSAASNFSLNRSYETHRDVLTAIQGAWNSTTETEFAYTSNGARQRTISSPKRLKHI